MTGLGHCKCARAPRAGSGYTPTHRCLLDGPAQPGQERDSVDSGLLLCLAPPRPAPNCSPFVRHSPAREAGQSAGGKPGAARTFSASPQTHISTISTCSQYGAPTTGSEGSQKERGLWSPTGLSPRPQLCHLPRGVPELPCLP